MFYNKNRMLENISRSVMSGFFAGETFFLILYPGYVTQFGDKMQAFRTTLRTAFAAFVIFSVAIFCVLLLLGRPP